MFENKKQLRTLKSAFTPAQLSKLKEFATVAETVQASPEAGLSMVMQLTQGGAVIAMASGVAEASALPIFIGPPIIAKMLTNPKASAKMIKLLTTPVSDPRATTALSKFFGDFSTQELEDMDLAVSQQEEQQ